MCQFCDRVSCFVWFCFYSVSQYWNEQAFDGLVNVNLRAGNSARLELITVQKALEQKGQKQRTKVKLRLHVEFSMSCGHDDICKNQRNCLSFVEGIC